MTRIVSFLHSEYDLDDMKRCDLEEIAVSSTEGITHALERVHKTKKGIVGKFSLELGEMVSLISIPFHPFDIEIHTCIRSTTLL